MKHTLLIGVIFVVIVPWIFYFNPIHQSQPCNEIYKNFSGETRTPIVSLNDKWTTTGSFFIGCGNVKSQSVYVFYTGNNQVGYTMVKLHTDGVRIFMDENNSPYYSTRTVWLDSLFGTCMPYTIQEIHVPNGTIVKQYSLDGE